MGKVPTRDGNALIADLKQRQNGLRTIGGSQGAYGAGAGLNLSLKTIEELASLAMKEPGLDENSWFGSVRDGPFFPARAWI
jgi:hypothetical protein